MYLVPSLPSNPRLTHPTGPLPNRPHPHNRHHKNPRILCAQAEMERHAGLRMRYRAYTDEVGVHWLCGGVVWYTGVVWGLLCDGGWVRWRYV